MKKEEKQPKLSSEHKEALAALTARPEFKALERLMKIEEHNIIMQSFKENSSNPDLVRKKAWQEGRFFELRMIMKTFEKVKKEDKE